MTRIVLVGAGSVEFTRNLLGDILSFPALRDAELVLHDIDPERLRTAERMAAWTADALGATPVIAAQLDRREALTGADFVINTIQVGGARATQIDFDIPGRYGLQYTINDTINVGGVLRGPADDPGRARDRGGHGRGLPRRAVPQLHEPDGHARPGGRRRDRVPDRRACATRCTGPSTPLAGYVGRAGRRGRRALGGRQPPRVDPAARAPRPRPVPGPRPVRRRGHASPTTTSSARTSTAGSASTPRSRRSTTPSTTRGSSPRTSWSRSTCRSASTSRGSRNNLDEYADTQAASSTPASRSRSSAAASTPR